MIDREHAEPTALDHVRMNARPDIDGMTHALPTCVLATRPFTARRLTDAR